MPYTVPTLAEAQVALASRLNDDGFVHWTAAELARYLRESLRTWAAWTTHWRDSATLTLTNPDVFLDLPTVLPLQRGYSVTSNDLVVDLQYALLEPPAGQVPWTGTAQFTLAQLTTAIQRRRDQFLRETGQVVTRSLTPYSGPISRVALDESVLMVRRAAWRPTLTQTLAPLQRTDEWAAQNFSPLWRIPDTQPPYAYSTTTTPPLEFQIIPPQLGDGTLDLLTIDRGTPIDPLTPVSLGIPDDWTWVVKWGALADLLHGDGLALDPQRAHYCEARWAQGIDLAKSTSVVLTATIGHHALELASVSDADSYSPLWQLLPGIPRTILTAGNNLLASWPPPGVAGGPWTLSLDLVCNAPVPLLSTDVLQISADIYDSILDYAQHLALAKEGPGELQLSLALLERATRAAGVTIDLQQAQQPSRVPLLSQTLQDEHAVDRESVGLSVS